MIEISMLIQMKNNFKKQSSSMLARASLLSSNVNVYPQTCTCLIIFDCLSLVYSYMCRRALSQTEPKSIEQACFDLAKSIFFRVLRSKGEKVTLTYSVRKSSKKANCLPFSTLCDVVHLTRDAVKISSVHLEKSSLPHQPLLFRNSKSEKWRSPIAALFWPTSCQKDAWK